MAMADRHPPLMIVRMIKLFFDYDDDKADGCGGQGPSAYVTIV